jgi:hypothetical protein
LFPLGLPEHERGAGAFTHAVWLCLCLFVFPGSLAVAPSLLFMFFPRHLFWPQVSVSSSQPASVMAAMDDIVGTLEEFLGTLVPVVDPASGLPLDSPGPEGTPDAEAAAVYGGFLSLPYCTMYQSIVVKVFSRQVCVFLYVLVYCARIVCCMSLPCTNILAFVGSSLYFLLPPAPSVAVSSPPA